MDRFGGDGGIRVHPAMAHGAEVSMAGPGRWLEPQTRILVHLAAD